jgi:UDP-glucose:glycoprotein glucosyltransferase
MKNLGYFQLQAHPGVFQLQLDKMRAEKLYEMTRGPEAIPQHAVSIRNFHGGVEQLRVRKRVGMEDASLLGDLQGAETPGGEDKPSGLVASVTSFFSGKGSEGDVSSLTPSKSTKDNTIHVFSLATGLLYERLLRIMMLSVTKRASAPVKFWLLGNFFKS